jgi:hypothetical protein
VTRAERRKEEGEVESHPIQPTVKEEEQPKQNAAARSSNRRIKAAAAAATVETE